MDSISQLGCIVCRVHEFLYTPAEIHHIGGKTKAEAHLNSIPLCFFHHRGGENTDHYVSRHPWKSAFEARYGLESELLDFTTDMVFEGRKE